MSASGPSGPLVLLSADFFKINFFENSLRNTIRVSNSLDPDQAPQTVWSYQQTALGGKELMETINMF